MSKTGAVAVTTTEWIVGRDDAAVFCIAEATLCSGSPSGSVGSRFEFGSIIRSRAHLPTESFLDSQWCFSTLFNITRQECARSPVMGGVFVDVVFVQMWYHLRAICFCMVTFGLSALLFTLMILMAPLVFIFDRNRRSLYAHINTLWAKLSLALFCNVKVEGTEHLAKETEPAVYVANHQSFMDIFALFFLNRPIKFISKSSVFLFPFLGWSMFLTGHIQLNRIDRRSQLKCLKDCQAMLEKRVPVVFFPEGTRSSDKKMLPFKKGAFTIAAKTDAPVIPITINGTGLPRIYAQFGDLGRLQATSCPKAENWNFATAAFVSSFIRESILEDAILQNSARKHRK